MSVLSRFVLQVHKKAFIVNLCTFQIWCASKQMTLTIVSVLSLYLLHVHKKPVSFIMPGFFCILFSVCISWSPFFLKWQSYVFQEYTANRVLLAQGEITEYIYIVMKGNYNHTFYKFYLFVLLFHFLHRFFFVIPIKIIWIKHW